MKDSDFRGNSVGLEFEQLQLAERAGKIRLDLNAQSAARRA